MGVTEGITGVFVGGLAWLGMTIPKAMADAIVKIGKPEREGAARLVKGGIDLALGIATIYDVAAHKKDDFWKGVGWTFGLLEAGSGGLSLIGALSWPEIPSIFEKTALKMLTGREY
jgi:hypothetical protein